jgi:hypothetical protein
MARTNKEPRPAKAKSASKSARKSAAGSYKLISREYQVQHEPDELAQRLRRRVNGADGRIDPAKLRALAEANGAWRDGYAALNPGMQFMNVSNRLRALVRHGSKVKWG